MHILLDPTFGLLAMIVLAAYSMGATIGFGAMVVSVTLGAHLYHVEFLVPVLIPLNIVTCAVLTLRHSEFIDRAILWKKLVPWTLLGMPVGMGLFYLLKQQWLKTAFGAFVFLYAATELITRFALKRAPGRLSEKRGALWLLSGGILQGMYGTGGPMMVIYANRVLTEKIRFRSTMLALFLMLNFLLIAGHTIGGNLTLHTLFLSSLLLVPLAFGILIGEWVHKNISEQRFRFLLFSLLALAGGSLVLRSWIW